jgi:hypothetical protein
MENWLINWTGFITSNIHAEINGLKYEDGPEWMIVMFELWQNNSDYGQKYKENKNKGYE